MKVRLISNSSTTSKEWIYLTPSIAFTKNHIILFWIIWILDFNFSKEK
jgi:hypothetical protein